MRFGILFELDTCILKFLFTLRPKDLIQFCQIYISEFNSIFNLPESPTDWQWMRHEQTDKNQRKIRLIPHFVQNVILCDQVMSDILRSF